MSRIDLSKLPEPVRQKLQERLDRLPAELREKLLASLAKVPPPMLAQLLEHGSPMLDKLLDSVEKQLPAPARPSAGSGSSARSVASSAPIAPGGLYSKTVQRGDNLSLRFVVVVLILTGVLVLLYRSGLLAG
ncbi:MAG: hypothetical protein WC213_05790 [Arenimonas sp.]|jgi:hypothetical protein